MHLKLRQIKPDRRINTGRPTEADDVQTMRPDGRCRKPKLVRQVAAALAVVPIAVGVGRPHPERADQKERDRPR
jgi:hypothetical protein